MLSTRDSVPDTPTGMPPAGRHRSPVRGFYLLVLVIAFVFDAAFVFAFVVDPVDFCLTSREAVDYVDVSFVYVRLAAALSAVALGFLGFSLALRPVRMERRMERALTVFGAELLAGISASAGLLGPSSEQRQKALQVVIWTHAAAATLAGLRALLTRQDAIDLPMALDEVSTAPAFRAHFEEPDTKQPSLERLERFLEVRSVRGSIRAQLRRSNNALSAVGGALVLLSLANFALELRRTLGADPPRLDESELAALNAPQPVESYFGDLPLQPRGSSRVVLLLVSGLRLDALHAVPALRTLFSSPELARDSLVLPLTAGPPSTSTAQWLALATGASAALTGVYGDHRLPETPFDSVFRQARLHGLSSFATGSPWFTELFHSQLLRPHRFFAEGAVAPELGTWAGWPKEPSYEQVHGDGFVAGRQADQTRMQLLHRALSAAHDKPTGTEAGSASGTGLGGARGASTGTGSRGGTASGGGSGGSSGGSGAWSARSGAAAAARGVLHPLQLDEEEGWLENEETSHWVPTITPTPTPGVNGHLFELLTAQLSQADVQAHCSGAAPGLDPRGAYVHALEEAAKHIGSLIRELDATTTLLIVSDHGSVDAGGSGGAEPLATQVPLVAYRPGSRLGVLGAHGEGAAHAIDVNSPRMGALYTPRPSGTRTGGGWRTVDVAPTIAALLGLPVPRESEGVPIRPLLPLANQQLLHLSARDVFLQRQRLGTALAAKLSVALGASEALLLQAEAPTQPDELARLTAELVTLHERLLHRAASGEAATSSLFTGLGALALGITVLAMVQRGSFADLQLAYHPVPGQYANRRAFAFALLALLASYGGALGGFLGLLHLRGYTSWDSTLLHYPTELVVYLIDAMLPALLIAFVVARTYHFLYLVTPNDEPREEALTDRSDAGETDGAAAATDASDDGYSDDSRSDDDDRESRGATERSRRSTKAKRTALEDDGLDRFGRGRPRVSFGLGAYCARMGAASSEYVRCLFLGTAPVYSDVSMIYLIKVYMLLLALLVHLVLTWLASRAYTFLVPPLLLVHFDVEQLWTYRFQLLTLQLLSGCVLAATVLAMRVWPPDDLSTAHYDRLYALAVLKYERRRGASAKSDDVVAMLEEETEALVRANYQAVADHGD